MSVMNLPLSRNPVEHSCQDHVLSIVLDIKHHSAFKTALQMRPYSSSKSEFKEKNSNLGPLLTEMLREVV